MGWRPSQNIGAAFMAAVCRYRRARNMIRRTQCCGGTDRDRSMRAAVRAGHRSAALRA